MQEYFVTRQYRVEADSEEGARTLADMADRLGLFASSYGSVKECKTTVAKDLLSQGV